MKEHSLLLKISLQLLFTHWLLHAYSWALFPSSVHLPTNVVSALAFVALPCYTPSEDVLKGGGPQVARCASVDLIIYKIWNFKRFNVVNRLPQKQKPLPLLCVDCRLPPPSDHTSKAGELADAICAQSTVTDGSCLFWFLVLRHTQREG